MFRQIKIAEQDQDYQRILWRFSPAEPVKEFKLTTVTYGTASAPYLAIRTLHQHAQNEERFYPKAAQVILRDFYVDDMMSGTNSTREALKLQNDLIQLLAKGGFKLRKWTSNNRTILEQIPKDMRESGILEISDNETIKTLGIHWNPNTDVFCFKVRLQSDNGKPTKRSLLSDTAKIFDPLGWLTPVTIQAKIILQQLWKATLTWDEPLPPHLHNEWNKYKKDMASLENIKITRWLSFDPTKDKIELHGFCDASEKAYAAVIYSRVTNPLGKVTIQLLTAKSKVAPLKSTTTIPRLELCAAELLSRLITQSASALEIQEISTYLWSDSMVTLAWIKGNIQKWKSFVANRVAIIRNKTHPCQWNYIKTNENPADCASRGVNPTQLNGHSLWWTGPNWLRLPKEKWPLTQLNISTNEEEREQRVTCTSILNTNIEIIERFSSLQKASRVIAYCYRFAEKCKGKSKPKVILPLSTEELERATNQLVHMTQLLEYHDEIKCLQKTKPLPTASKLLPLNPFMDEKGILRVGGRLQHSNLSFNEKHPIILPHKSHLTKLIIDDAHVRTLHGGNQMTLAYLRRKYWILNARNSIREYIHKCITCTRYKAKITPQIMGMLPAARVTPSKPFTHAGVDYAGPITLKLSKGRGCKTYKGYIAIFVCMTTKAVHIEAVSDMTSNAFIAAFKRFTARRGLCNHLYSDCGSNFVGAKKIMENDILTLLKNHTKEIGQTLASDGTNWHFNPPAAPHFGGLWEAGVKSIKHHLKRIIGETILTFEELSTVLSQIEACLNSRPLCSLSNDPTDIDALTPGHFLIGRAPVSPPEPEKEEATTSYLTRWQLVTKLYKDFWKAWSTEYLSRLQQRPKWRAKQNNITPGQLVLLKEEHIPPSKWPLARVSEVHPGQDGVIRVVSLRCKGNSILKRPITKICLLPIDNEPQEVQEHTTEVTSNLSVISQKNSETTTISEQNKPNLKRKAPDSEKSPIQEKKQYGSAAYNQLRKMLKEHNKNKKKSVRIHPVTGYSKLIPLHQQQKRTEEHRQLIKRSIVAEERPTKMFKRNNISILDHPLILCLIILFLAKIGKCTYSITHPEPGLYIEHIGEALIRRGTLRIVLNYPTNITMDSERINNTIGQIKRMCSTTKEFSHEIHCNQLVEHLLLKQNTLLAEMALLERKMHTRTKRGILGRVLQSLFGVNDEVYADIETLNQNQLLLRQSMQHQSTLMISTVKAMNNTENRTVQKINMINSKLNSVISEVNKGQEWFATVDHNKANIHILAAYQLASDLIAEFEDYYMKLVRITLSKGSLFDFITPGQLMDIITKASLKIPSTLQLIPEPESRVELAANSTNINIYGYLHITGADVHTVDKVTPIPQRLDNFTYIVPDITTSIIAISYNTQTYFELTETEFARCTSQENHMYLCSPTVVSSIESNPNCIIDEIYHRHEKRECTWIKLSTPTIMWKHLYMKNTWLFIANRPITAAIKCNGIREEAVLNGTGIMWINQGCVIKTKKNTLNSELINTIPIKSTYIKPIHINISNIPYSNQPQLKHLDPEPVLKPSDQLSGLFLEETLSEDNTPWKTIGQQTATGATAVVTTIVLIGIAYKIKTWRTWKTWKVKNNTNQRLPTEEIQMTTPNNTPVPVPRANIFILKTPQNNHTDCISEGENV